MSDSNFYKLAKIFQTEEIESLIEKFSEQDYTDVQILAGKMTKLLEKNGVKI
jgi:hypothetical protein